MTVRSLVYLRRTLRHCWAALAFVSCMAHAAVIAPAAPVTSVPGSLVDPLNSFGSAPLQAGQFLLPIAITGASNLQDWSFDLTFDGTVVALLDIGGLYQSVYQTEFNALDQTVSDITSSGLALNDSLTSIAGFFSSSVAGDGLLAYVLFAYLPGQENNDPNFGVAGVDGQRVPEPGTLVLAFGAIVLIGMRRRFRR